MMKYFRMMNHYGKVTETNILEDIVIYNKVIGKMGYLIVDPDLQR